LRKFFSSWVNQWIYYIWSWHLNPMNPSNLIQRWIKNSWTFEAPAMKQNKYPKIWHISKSSHIQWPKWRGFGDRCPVILWLHPLVDRSNHLSWASTCIYSTILFGQMHVRESPESCTLAAESPAACMPLSAGAHSHFLSSGVANLTGKYFWGRENESKRICQKNNQSEVCSRRWNFQGVKDKCVFFWGCRALVRPPFPPSGKISTPFPVSFSIRVISKIHHVVAAILRN